MEKKNERIFFIVQSLQRALDKSLTPLFHLRACKESREVDVFFYSTYYLPTNVCLQSHLDTRNLLLEKLGSEKTKYEIFSGPLFFWLNCNSVICCPSLSFSFSPFFSLSFALCFSFSLQLSISRVEHAYWIGTYFRSKSFTCSFGKMRQKIVDDSFFM